MHQQGRIFFYQFTDGHTHFISISLCFRLNGIANYRFREIHGFQHDFGFLGTQGIPGFNVFEAYYRTVLTRNGWRLVNDQRDRDGGVALLAELKGQPLWVNIKSTDDSVATIVRLAGAVIPDSVKNTPAKAAS